MTRLSVANKIIIPGGGGYLGKAISQVLVDRGDEVVVLTRGPARKAGGISHINWDGTTLGPWVEELDGGDAVVHLTGQRVDVRNSKRNVDELISSRVQPVRVVGEALAVVDNPPPVWVQSSSLAIYGDGGDALIDETHTPSGLGPRGMVTVCLAWEHAFGLATVEVPRTVVLRAGIGFGGPGDPATKKLAQLVKMGLGGHVGNGRQWISWVDLRDMVRIFVRAIDDPSMAGLYHATSPNPVTNKAMMAAFRTALGRDFGMPSPAPLAYLGAPLVGSSAKSGLIGRRAIPTKLLAEGFAFDYPSIDESIRFALSQL